MPAIAAPEPESTRVFLSYRREDAGSEASRLAEALSQAFGSDSVFWDRDSLQGGDDWPRRLREAAPRCQAAVVLIGPRWLSAQNPKNHKRRIDEPKDWLRLEIELALGAWHARGLCVIPMLLDGAQMPEPEDLPESIAELASCQTMALSSASTSAWHASAHALVQRLRDIGVAPRAELWLDAYLGAVKARFAQHLRDTAFGAANARDVAPLTLLVQLRSTPPDATTPTAAMALEEALALAGPVRLLLNGEGGGGKTTSLLQTAARAAAKAATDRDAPLPVYVNLAGLSTDARDEVDLLHHIDLALPQAATGVVLTLELLAQRRLLFLFDGFNEIKPSVQGPAARAVQRFIAGFAERHGVVLASRPNPQLAALESGSALHRQAQIQRFDATQVREHLTALGLSALHDGMPEELKALAGNPFMLMAVVRTFADAPAAALPRNRGALYQQFVNQWMRREDKLRSATFNFQRVKAPLLGRLAAVFTAAGVTLVERAPGFDSAVGAMLADIHRELERGHRDGLPRDWTLDAVLAETAADGLLRDDGGQQSFLHQSVQDYFVAAHFGADDPEWLARCTPRWVAPESEDADPLFDLPGHRFVPALLMLAGVLPDASRLVEVLAERNPVLAAATLGAATRVEPALQFRLESSWIAAALDSADATAAALACACLRHARRETPRVLEALFKAGRVDATVVQAQAHQALGALTASDASKQLVLRLVLDEQDALSFETRSLILAWSAAFIVESVLHLALGRPEILERAVRLGRWESDRRALAAAVPPVAERRPALQAVAAAFAQLLTEKSADDVADVEPPVRADAAVLPRTVAPEAWPNALDDPDPGTRLAAVRMGLALGEMDDATVLAVVLDEDHDEVRRELLALPGLVSNACIERLWNLAGGERDRVVATLQPPAVAPSIVEQPLWKAADRASYQALEPAVAAALRRELPHLTDVAVWQSYADGDAAFSAVIGRRVSTDGSGGVVYYLKQTPLTVELKDVDRGDRATRALRGLTARAAQMPELLDRLDDPRPDVQLQAIRCVSALEEPAFTALMLERLRSRFTGASARLTLEALGSKAADEPVRDALVTHLLLLEKSDSGAFDVHPQWGRDEDWFALIWNALGSAQHSWTQDPVIEALLCDPVPQRVELALKVLDHATSAFGQKPAGDGAWLGRVVELALVHDDADVRSQAASVLKHSSEWPLEQAMAQLRSDSSHAALCAAESLAAACGATCEAEVAARMVHLLAGGEDLPLRERAAAVLTSLPNGTAPAFAHWLTLINRNKEAALAWVDRALQALPDDVDLHWARAHTLSDLGRIPDALAEFERVFEKAETSDVARALIGALKHSDNLARACEVAKRISAKLPHDAQAQALLAQTLFEAGDWPGAMAAAAVSLDLDPVQSESPWVATMAHLQAGDTAGARRCLDHACRIWLHFRDALEEDEPVARLRAAAQALELDGEAAAVRDALLAALLPVKTAASSST